MGDADQSTVPPAAASTAEAAPPPAAPSKDEKTMALLCHLLGGLVGFLVPLIIWLIKKDTMPFVDDQGKEALNFQISILIAYVAIGVLSGVTCGLGAVAFPVVWIASLVLGIMGGLKANEGVAYRYPFALRLIK